MPLVTPTRIFISAIRCIPDECDSGNAGCHYRVAWSINPHMRVGAVRPLVARRQLRHFARALRAAGAEVIELPFVHGAYDCVFTKDNALLSDGSDGPRALLARPRCRERHGEQAARRRMLEAHGFSVEVSDVYLEGGDVVRLPGGGALVGYGFRSEPRAAERLHAHLGRRVLPLRLVEPRLYHLDTALAVLADGTALACREAFDGPSWQRLQRAPGVRRVIEVALDEAATFALNLVEIGDSIIVDTDAPRVTRVLDALGKRIVRVDLSEFRLAGGSAACLCAIVQREEERLPAPERATEPLSA